MPVSIKPKLLIAAFLLLYLIILSACAGAPATEESAAPEEPSEELPVAYGQDSRMELFQHPDARLKEMSTSVAVLVHSQQVNQSGNSVSLSGYTLNEMSEKGLLIPNVNVPICSSEPFATQTAPGVCTGFLVGEDTLITAGHCLQKIPCSDTSIVFGFQMESVDSLAGLTNADVFKCTEIIAQVLPSPENQYLDYAILRLDRSTGRAGLVYATGDTLATQTNVAVVGHPSGLPMKIASGAFVMRNETDAPFFVTNLDTFVSNSGSPVINTTTYQVEGILVRGEIDYILSDDGSCVQVNHCPEDVGANCAGENATKMSMLANKIPETGSASSEGLTCVPGLLTLAALALLARLKLT